MFHVLKELVRDGEQQEIATAETEAAARAIAEQEVVDQEDCRVLIELRDGATARLFAVYDPKAQAE